MTVLLFCVAASSPQTPQSAARIVQSPLEVCGEEKQDAYAIVLPSITVSPFRIMAASQFGDSLFM